MSSNWSPAGAPGSADNVVINAGSPHYPTLNLPTHVKGVTVASGASLHLGANGWLYASGNLSNAGAITLAAGSKVLDSAKITNSGDISVSGNAVIHAGAVANAITNSGTMEIASGATLSANQAITNTATGSISLSGGKLADGYGVSNAHLISGYGEITGSVTNSASGTVEASGGGHTLTLDSVVTGGQLKIDAGATLDANQGGSVKSVTFSGSGGALDVGSGELDVTDAMTVASGNSVNLAGGTLNAIGGITDNGAISGYGTLQGELNAGSGALTATGGTLEVTDTLDGGLSLQIDSGSGSEISLLSGGSAASATFTGSSGGALGLSDGQFLSLDNALDVQGNAVDMGLNSFLADTAGVSIEGGSITGGAIGAPVTGYGTVSSDIGGTVTASGGALNLSGAQDGNELHVAAGSSLNLSGAATSVDSLTFDSSSSGAATIGSNLDVGSALSVGSGNTLTVNGSLSDGAGVTLNGGTLAGSGLLAAGTGVTGHGAIGVAINGGHTIVAQGGTLSVNGPVDQSGGTATAFQIGNGATLTFAGPVGTALGVDPTVKFNSANGVLNYTGAAGGLHLGTISGFQHGDQIDLGAAFAGGSVTVSGNTATFTGAGGVTETLTFASNTGLSGLQLNGSGDVTICFMPGTMIRTPDGEVAVETLKPGDLVLTHLGGAKPVNWVGRQTLSRRFTTPLRSWPVRVRAGALGPQTPVRDLLLSPDHALLVDGVLIHAGALVNGSSITRETSVPDVWTYYHVELDDHSLIFADGAPAETFVDNVDRLNFDNWAEYEALYPEGKAIDELPYPRAKAHRQVPVYIRILMAERALAHAGAAVA